MKQKPSITCLFVDVGGVLLTNGWDHHARRRAVAKFKLDWAEMEERHRLVFEIHEEGKLTFEEYLSLVVFYEKRPSRNTPGSRFHPACFRTYSPIVGIRKHGRGAPRRRVRTNGAVHRLRGWISIPEGGIPAT